jgi:hypothetical protein
MEEFKAERKPTEENLDEYPEHDCLPSYLPAMNENMMAYTNQ